MLPDYGFLDWVYVKSKGSGEDPNINFDEWNITPFEPMRRGTDSYWFCFLPSIVAHREDILPESGTIYRYILPSRAISAERGKTVLLLERMVDSVYVDIDFLGLSQAQINFLGISLGNCPAYYLAGNGIDAARIISVVPGANLPWCVHNGLATRRVGENARGNGYNHEDLEGFSPISHIGKIASDTEMELWLGGRDLIVPSESGEELERGLTRERANLDVKKDSGSGHVQSIGRFVRDWQRKP
jgi:hypothetical protein